MSSGMTEQDRLDMGEEYRQSAMAYHAKTVVVTTRMRREQTTLVAMLAAAEKLRRSMSVTVTAGAEFNRIFGGLNSVVASSALHLKDQRERVNGLVDLLAGQNAAMHTVSIALEEQFIKPLEMTASGWKVQAAAQEAQEAKYSKTQSKKSAALTKHAHTCRQARDKALQGSANEAKSVKATSKLNDVMVEYDRFFEQFAMTSQTFYEDAEREEKARYNSILKASKMVARGCASLAKHAEGFEAWVGGKVDGKRWGSREDLMSLRTDDGPESQADEYIDVSGDDRRLGGANGGDGVADWLIQHQKPDPAQNVQPGPRHTGSLSLHDDAAAHVALSVSPTGAGQHQRGEASPERTRRAAKPRSRASTGGGGGGGGDGVIHESQESDATQLAQGAEKVIGVWSSKRQKNRTSARGASLRFRTKKPAAEPEVAAAPVYYTGNAIAIFPYKPVMPDELELVTGMPVEVLHESDDGWVNGVAVESGATGWFHRSFVQRDEDAIYFITRKSFIAAKSSAGQQKAMGFGPDERMRILDKTSEQWWMAMNVSSLPSETGFIPASFVAEEHRPKARARGGTSASDAPVAPRRGVKKGKAAKSAQLQLSYADEGDDASTA